MDMSGMVIEHIRKSVGLTEDNSEFDTELLNHINLSIVKANQNGVKLNKLIVDEVTTWDELVDTDAIGYDAVGALPTFISLNVKLLFDPPPPSSVEFHVRSLDESLWRLRMAYEQEGEDE